MSRLPSQERVGCTATQSHPTDCPLLQSPSDISPLRAPSHYLADIRKDLRMSSVIPWEMDVLSRFPGAGMALQWDIVSSPYDELVPRSSCRMDWALARISSLLPSAVRA